MRTRSPVVAVAFAALAMFGVAVAACAQLVGADFGDEYLRGTDGGIATDDAGGITPPGDSAPPPKVDAASPPPVAAEGGTCPTGLTDCGGLCFDLTSSPEHCGKCSTTCPNDPHGAGVCVISHCTFACDEGWIECAGGCCGTGGDDASSTVDSAPPPTNDGGSGASGIACGSAYCPVATNSFCCGASSGDTCSTDLGSSSCAAAEVFCDDATQCGGGGVCCWDVASTQTLCEPTSCGADQYQLCDPAASGECTGGKSCTGTFTPSHTSYDECE